MISKILHVSYSNENLIQKYQTVISENQLVIRVKIPTSSVPRTRKSWCVKKECVLSIRV